MTMAYYQTLLLHSDSYIFVRSESPEANTTHQAD